MNFQSKIGQYFPSFSNLESKYEKINQLKKLKESIQKEFIQLPNDNERKLKFIQTAIISLHNYHAELNLQRKIMQYDNCEFVRILRDKLSNSSCSEIPDMKKVCSTDKKSKIVNFISNSTLLTVPLCGEAKELEEFIISLIPDNKDNFALYMGFVSDINVSINNLQKEIAYTNHQKVIDLFFQIKQYFSLPILTKENIQYFLKKLNEYNSGLNYMYSNLKKIEESLDNKNKKSFSYFKRTNNSLLQDIGLIESLMGKIRDLIEKFEKCSQLPNVPIEDYSFKFIGDNFIDIEELENADKNNSGTLSTIINDFEDIEKNDNIDKKDNGTIATNLSAL